ncbi:MAG: formate dehydrogenase accessory sulfurtransferase FdhD [Clostridia bacterium]|jgi:FdhD protein|nr:formate dehydrogenase accessory sulfurtransferase FdhD [Clostridia bacterium]MBT7122098.1 formate dehydrogenase accessory sulfurtransferase FdhD [Clostridia bacterium]
MDVTKQFDIINYSGGELESVADSVVVEYSLTVFLNGDELVTMLCTPKSLQSLVVGFLYSEGIIESFSQISDIFICHKDGIALVTLTKKRMKAIGDIDFRKTITSGCASGKSVENVSAADYKKIETTIKIDQLKVLELIKQFNKKSEIFLKTGGVHSCALCSQDEIILFEEDIGRHNALEKILGQALQDNIDLSDKMILTSGRISSEIIKKAAKRRIPVVVSRSAPTDAAIDLAKSLGITLIGFARGARMNIYTQYP